jgi:peptidoglycan/LPS O-acetylase OafA/YrhL
MSTSSGLQRADGHVAVLDGVRAVSILMVLSGHLLPLGPKFLALNAPAATGGMSLFFVLSGFLITRFLLESHSLLEFYVKRLARILPLAYLYMISVFLLFDHDWRHLLSELTFTINFQPDQFNEYNTHLWSLCVEIQFYLVVGLIFALLRRQAKWLILGLCAAATVARICEPGLAASSFTQVRGDEILAGSLLCLSVSGAYGDHGRFWRLLGRLTPLLAIGVILCSHPAMGVLNDARAYVGAMFVGSVLFCAWSPITVALSSRPMAYIAKISYALYVIHPAAASGVLAGGPKWFLYLVKRPITLAITFALANLSTYGYEAFWTGRARRFLTARRSRLQQSAALAPAAAVIAAE